MVFERKILRKIFGPTYENGSWRIKTNEELDKLIKHENIINFGRAHRLGLYGHIERMQDTRMVKAIHAWKSISKRPTGRPKIRREDKEVKSAKLEDPCPGETEDGRKWLGRAKLCTKNCRTVLRRSYIFRHYRVILRQLVFNTLPSYSTISNAAVGNTIYK